MRPLQTRRLLAEDVADRIREEILAGRVVQGERLVEAGIAEELCVSRGPVREALKLLRGEGLVSEEPHRGAFVAHLSGTDVRDMLALRGALEACAARQVATRRRPSDILSMRRLFERLVEAVNEGDMSHVVQADVDFHEGVCRLSGNRRLLEVYARYVPLLKSFMRLDEFLYESLDDVACEHESMLQAIEAGDADLAAARFVAHTENACDALVAHVNGLTHRAHETRGRAALAAASVPPTRADPPAPLRGS